MLKLAIFGNRNITDETLIVNSIADHVVFSHPTVVLHGGASGPSAVAVEMAKNSEGLWTDVLFKPWSMVWSKLEFKPIFFYLRNKQIVENADKVIVFDNGEKDSEVYRVIELCKRKEKDFVVVEV